ncbi:hypothetical protein RTBOTA2_002047 [Rhodotorula toruloides]|uniref:Uncharacterized protein n=1 Tax=Rhodotorula toruloides TaxID=5286 RepID=A0A0K3CMY1_RHOTO|nr:hypothetical protein RTBOTA2_002047 [Rhodotorula toruloides]PRQ73232.1 hypothetical protein AAT19DRAFT_15985 [Rhodotorula toruloides]
MPSIKSCLASLALVALAISPVAATPLKVNDAALVRRAPEPAFFSNEAAIEKRDVSRKEIAARLKRAKIAAARKAKRENRERDTSELVKRHVAALHEREGVTEEVLERRAIVERALRRTRCGVNDRICTQSVTSPSDLPANGRAVCGPNHLCQVGCQPGYVLTNGACVASEPTCGPNSCGTTPNGVFLCSGANTCALVCDTSNGYTARGNQCINTNTDAANCGTVGNACPASYNGVGQPVCRGGSCRIACPPGTVNRLTQDRSAFYCYGTPLGV